MANRNRSNIPKFGEWKDGGASMPYTVVFDKARMKKTDPNFNPNDPSHYQELIKEKPAIPKPNAPQPRQMKGGAGERREERRYPPSTTSQAYEHPGEDQLVPEFGAWNDPNSSAGNDFTGQFQKVGEQRNRDKNPGALTPPNTYQPHRTNPYSKGRVPHQSSSKCKCVIL